MNLTASLGCPNIWLPAVKTPAKITENLVFNFLITSVNDVEGIISINYLPLEF